MAAALDTNVEIHETSKQQESATSTSQEVAGPGAATVALDESHLSIEKHDVSPSTVCGSEMALEAVVTSATDDSPSSVIQSNANNQSSEQQQVQQKAAKAETSNRSQADQRQPQSAEGGKKQLTQPAATENEKEKEKKRKNKKTSTQAAPTATPQEAKVDPATADSKDRKKEKEKKKDASGAAAPPSSSPSTKCREVTVAECLAVLKSSLSVVEKAPDAPYKEEIQNALQQAVDAVTSLGPVKGTATRAKKNRKAAAPPPPPQGPPRKSRPAVPPTYRQPTPPVHHPDERNVPPQGAYRNRFRANQPQPGIPQVNMMNPLVAATSGMTRQQQVRPPFVTAEFNQRLFEQNNMLKYAYRPQMGPQASCPSNIPPPMAPVMQPSTPQFNPDHPAAVTLRRKLREATSVDDYLEARQESLDMNMEFEVELIDKRISKLRSISAAGSEVVAEAVVTPTMVETGTFSSIPDPAHTTMPSHPVPME